MPLNFGKENVSHVNETLIKYCMMDQNPILGIINLVYIQPNYRENANFLPINGEHVLVFYKSMWTVFPRKAFIKKLVTRALQIGKSISIPGLQRSHVISSDMSAVDDMLMFYMPYFNHVIDKAEIGPYIIGKTSTVKIASAASGREKICI